MKRIYAIVILLGIVMSAVLTGCDNGSKPTETPAPGTNAPAATPDMPSTNK